MKSTLLLFAALLVLARTGAEPVTVYTVQNHSAAVERDVPVTFGAVFAPGAVPSGTSLVAEAAGKAVPLQVDVKANNKDGSLRHAIVTAVLPRLASGQSLKLVLNRGAAAQGAPLALSVLPSNFDGVVALTLGSARLSISLRDLVAHQKPETWLSGPLVSEWWFNGPFRDASGKADPHLNARFGVRSYGANRPLRIELDVENAWTWVPDPRTQTYAIEIRLGDKIAFTKPRIIQQSQTRWRLVFWWGPKAEVFVRHDLAYLKSTRAIPNFDTSGREPGVDAMYRLFQAKFRGPMGEGIISPAMPATGQRPDIGPLPGWTVAYLLTMDLRAAEMTYSAGDLSGSFASHYRNERTGRPATSEDFPNISTHYNYVGRGAGNLQAPDFAGTWKGLSPEAAHEPSLAFVPYLLSGERYYLEELQFWSQWNAWATAPGYHGFGKGLISWDQIRGQAWSLRTLAQAAFITPDADPLKPVLLREMKANAEWYDATYTNNPAANIFHVALRASDDTHAVAPWMDDYLTWAAQYAVQLGFDEFRSFARWKAVFPVQRMINPDYCYVLATKYYMMVMESQHRFFDSWAKAYVGNVPKQYRTDQRLECGSDEMASALKLKRAGEMMGDAESPEGYPAQMQPALAAAVDAGVPGAAEAWAKFRSRPVQPRGGIDPRWNIVPFGH